MKRKKKKVLKPSQRVHRILPDDLKREIGANYQDVQAVLNELCFDREINSIQILPVEIDWQYKQRKLIIPLEHLQIVACLGVYTASNLVQTKNTAAQWKTARQPLYLSDEDNAISNQVVNEHQLSVFFFYLFHRAHNKLNDVLEVGVREMQQMADQVTQEIKN